MAMTSGQAALRQPERVLPVASLGTAPEQGPELAVVVPTLNERGNVGPLIDRPRDLVVGVGLPSRR
jgi:hypothetical protein